MPFSSIPRRDLYLDLLGRKNFAWLEEVFRLGLITFTTRVNTLKARFDQDWPKWSEWYGWEWASEVPFCPTAMDVVAFETPPGRTLEHADGYYFVQDASSTLPVELFDDHPAPLVLDMAAAPGGKTTHLISRYQDRGLVLANDSSARRLGALQANLQRWSGFGTLVTNFPGERFGRWYPETFDRVLLDAPCSGETLWPGSGGRGRGVSEKERARLCTRQIVLLSAAVEALKVGGEVVYVTCTMAPEEDEAVLDELLRRYPEAVEIVAPPKRVQVKAPALGEALGQRFSRQVRRAVRLWPHLYETSGLFAARIRKTAPVPTEAEAPPSRPWGITPLKRADVARLLTSLQDVFGFALEPILEANGLTLWAQERTVYAVPQRAVELFGELPHRSAGLMLGRWQGDVFLPSRALITRYLAQFQAPRLELDEKQALHWLKGRDLRGVKPPAGAGPVVLCMDRHGRFLGRAKVLPNRLRNLLPKHMVGHILYPTLTDDE